MPFEPKDLTGALFRNDDKDAEHPKWPDYTGSMFIGGVDYWLSGYVATAKQSGKKYIKLSLKAKDAQNDAPKPAPAEPPPAASDLPF